MATINGSTNEGANPEWTFKIEVSESDLSDKNNTSKVTAKIYMGRKNSASYFGGNYTYTITINGNKYDGSANAPYPTNVAKGGWVQMGSHSATVTHDNNGSKSITVSATQSSSAFWPNYCNASGTVTLTTLDRQAPSVSLTSSSVSTTSLQLSGSSGSTTCDSWDYKIDSGSWTNYSTQEGTSSSKTVTGLTSSSHSVQVRARKKSNNVYGYSDSKPVDLIAPVVSFSITNPTVSGATISATSDVNCNAWDYSLDGGTTWTSFSTTSGTSASVTLDELDVNTSYTVSLRAKKASNGLYGNAQAQSFTTLGNTKINSTTTYYPDAPTLTITFNWTIYVASYHHRLEIKDGSTTVLAFDDLTGSATTTNKSITITAGNRNTLLNLIPSNSKTKTLEMSLTTYDSYSGGTYGTQIGPVNTCAFVISTTQTNSGPTLACSVTDINATTTALTGDDSKLILNASNAQCVLTATAKNGATIAVNTINGMSTTSYVYYNVAVNSFVFYIRDSRGYELTQTITPAVVNYVLPTCIMSVERVSPVSTNKVNITFSGRYYNGSFATSVPNTLTVKYQYKETSASTYSSDVVISGSSITTTSTSYASNDSVESAAVFDYTKTYDIKMTVSDMINTVIQTYTIAKGVPIFDWGADDFEFHVPAILPGDPTLDSHASNKKYVDTHVEYIKGTQTGVTSSWTGVTKDSALYDGKMIMYVLPYEGTTSGATLNLTLAGGGSTGAKNIYKYGNSVPVTTNYPAQSRILMIYDYDNARWNCTDTTYTNMSQNEATAGTSTTARSISAKVIHDTVVDLIYPVGSIYISVNNTSPATLFGGTWQQVAEGRTLFGAGTLGNNTYTAGDTVNAGLPNLSGDMGLTLSDYNLGNTSYGNYVTGAFKYREISGTNQNLSSGSYDAQRVVSMDASQQNSIYGGSDTVQPPAFVVYIWKRTA